MKLLAILAAVINASTTIDPIYWRVDNARFPDVRHVHFEEKMDIFCPDMRDGDSSSVSHHYQKIYMVDRESYESCQRTSKATYITTCNAPKREKKFTIKFQQVNPMPYGLEFSEGTYYLISTSGGTDESLIDQTLGGVCQSHGMRVKLEVTQGVERGPEVIDQNQNDQSTVHRTTEVNKPTEYTIQVLPDVTPEHYTQTVSTAIIVGIVFLVFIMFLVVIAFILFRRTSLKSKSSAFNPSTMSDYTIGKGGSFQDSYQDGIHHYAPPVHVTPPHVTNNNQQIPYINNPADYGQKIVTLYPNHVTRTNQTLNQSQLASDFTYRPQPVVTHPVVNHNTSGSYVERLSERTDQTVLV